LSADLRSGGWNKDLIINIPPGIAKSMIGRGPEREGLGAGRVSAGGSYNWLANRRIA
jgi:hypothetical protein